MSTDDEELRALRALLDRIRGTPGGAADPGDGGDVAGESSPPLELDLIEAFEGELLEDSFDGLAPLDVPPAAASRIVATGLPPRAPSIDDFDDGQPIIRARPDPLAQTTQNPLPAAMFQEATRGPSVGDEPSPASSPRPVDPAEPADDGLESEPPPESGEMASQRQPAVGSMRSHDLDLDAPTALAESEDLARALEARIRVEAALQPEVVAAAAAAPPRVVARSPLAAASFLEILDAALSFGER